MPKAYFPLFNFLAFVLWLLLFPLQGPWAAPPNSSPLHPAVFLLPHAFVLGAIGFSPAVRRRLDPLAAASAVVTAVLTATYPFVAGLRTAVMLLLGAVSAPLAVRVTAGLASTWNPLRAAAWGLVGSNILLLAVSGVPGPYWVRMALAGGLPLLTLWRPQSLPKTSDSGDKRVGQHALFGFLMGAYALNGIFYEKLFPAYAQVARLPGVEILAYAAAVLLAFHIGRTRPKIALIGGLVSGFAALALFHPSGAVRIHGSMGFMQIASGFWDAFVLLFCLAQPDPIRAVALGLGSICGGLGVGCLVGGVLPDHGELTLFVGAFLLNGALLVLYAFSAPDPVPPWDSSTPPPRPAYRWEFGIPLSSRERDVLDGLARGLSNRAIAERLGISPSSVQTYARRIYAKADVGGREELLHRLQHSESEHAST